MAHTTNFSALLRSQKKSPQSKLKFSGYLLTTIGNMEKDELNYFLHFVTGSSVLVTKQISISFNNLSGLSRGSISHTCSNTLELPTTYLTYPEFAQEFLAVFTSEAA